ncbi:MAG: hypothetical protein LBQ60_02635 [Bacteroidales bacterium]|jgi:hypothetical protein|nr:hypothetical protein [Bacteroidales bacterium]
MNTGTKAGLVIWGILTVVLLYAAFTNKTVKVAKEDPVTDFLKDQFVFTADVVSSYYSDRDSLSFPEEQLPVLIYRYTEKACGSCIFEELNELYQFKESMDTMKLNILILPTFPDNRNNRIKLANDLANFIYINIPAHILDVPKQRMGDEEKRYFAVIDKNRDMKMVFFPQITKLHITRQYLKEVGNQFTSLQQ